MTALHVTRDPLRAFRAVRALAVRTLARRLGIAPEAPSLTSRARIPRAELRGGSLSFNVSLSHHGRFGAVACDGRVALA